MRFGWPGVYFEGRFRGTGLKVALLNGSDRLRLLIDGVEKRRFEHTGRIDAVVTGLAHGEHRFRLEKLTQTQAGSSVLLGFYPLTDGQALPPSRGTGRQIEFIGDSYTVGYGNSAPGRTCTQAEIHATTDTQRAFGPIVARHFGAEYRVNAYSGFGIVRNYGGTRPGESMPVLYPRLIPSDPVPVEVARGKWRPRIIVINLGTNDFSTPLHAGERWAGQAALHADYRTRYIAFVRGLMVRQPQARFILMASDGFFADVAQVAAALNQAAPRVSTVQYGGLDRLGCDSHPSLKDHHRLAGLLQPEIERIRW